jgi:predicted TIM-barrel fold metal-dependent hydrolase
VHTRRDAGGYDRRVIVDCHTHIFPPDIAERRDAFAAADATFASLYANANAKLATAEELLSSMDRAGVDVSVALGFAWRDPEVCRAHNDYLLEAGLASGGRLLAFCTLPLAADADVVAAEARRCLLLGARGFGELRPDDLECDLAGRVGSALAEVAEAAGVPLLLHASEPVGHAYPGKRGLALERLYAFIVAHPGLRLIAAHWGGGLPFYALMPEVRAALAGVRFDTAATSLLYEPAIYRLAAKLVGMEAVFFGSDFPLLSQRGSLRRLRETGLSEADIHGIAGENAARWLGLSL